MVYFMLTAQVISRSLLHRYVHLCRLYPEGMQEAFELLLQRAKNSSPQLLMVLPARGLSLGPSMAQGLVRC